MSKINKLGKSTFVIAILSFLLVAVLAFGGTYAYFSAQTSATGSITTGHLTINVGENTTAALTAKSVVAQPNQVIFNETVKTEVLSNISYYTRVRFAIEISDATTDHNDTEGQEDCYDRFEENFTEIFTIKITDGTEDDADVIGGVSGSGLAWEVEDDTAIDYTQEVVFYQLAPTVKEDKLDKTTNVEKFTYSIQVEDWVGLAHAGSADGCTYWMDRTVTVTVFVEVLQADYLGDDQVADAFANGAKAAEAWEDALTVTK